MKCPICDNLKFKKIFNLYDDRYGEPNLYLIKECLKCGHLCTFPRIKKEDLSNLYGNFYPRKNINIKSLVDEAEKESRKFSRFFRWLNGTNNQGQFFIKETQSMLDIGCGSGLSLIEVANMGGHAFGVEADPNIKNLAEKLNLDIFIGDLNKNTYKGKVFDLVVMNQVIEHIPEPNKFLEIIKDKMSKKSTLIISFPNTKSFWRYISGKKWINWHVPYHLHHFNDVNFERMAKNCGFKIVNKKTITPNIWTIMQIRAFFKNTKLGEKNNLWNQAYSNKKNMKSKKLIFNSIKIFLKFILQFFLILLNRIIDIFGMGDSLIFFLILEKA